MIPPTGLEARLADLPAVFRDQLAQNAIAYKAPDGFRLVAAKANDRVTYDLALATDQPNLEIRFQIVSLNRLPLPDGFTPIAQVDMNALHDVHTLALIRNIASQIVSGPNALPAASVGPEFGADRGTVTRLVLAQSAFGEGFVECLLLALHKENVADVYVFFLFDDFERAADRIQAAFYTLTFSEAG